MLDEAEAHGLLVDPARRHAILGGDGRTAAPDPRAPLHESLTGPWHLAEYLPKRNYNFTTRQEEWRANRHRRRTVPANALIHWSVYERGPAYVATLGLPRTAVMVPRPGGAANWRVSLTAGCAAQVDYPEAGSSGIAALLR